MVSDLVTFPGCHHPDFRAKLVDKKRVPCSVWRRRRDSDCTQAAQIRIPTHDKGTFWGVFPAIFVRACLVPFLLRSDSVAIENLLDAISRRDELSGAPSLWNDAFLMRRCFQESKSASVSCSVVGGSTGGTDNMALLVSVIVRSEFDESTYDFKLPDVTTVADGSRLQDMVS